MNHSYYTGGTHEWIAVCNKSQAASGCSYNADWWLFCGCRSRKILLYFMFKKGIQHTAHCSQFNSRLSAPDKEVYSVMKKASENKMMSIICAYAMATMSYESYSIHYFTKHTKWCVATSPLFCRDNMDIRLDSVAELIERALWNQQFLPCHFYIIHGVVIHGTDIHQTSFIFTMKADVLYSEQKTPCWSYSLYGDTV